ncbi:hypothetical protein F2Q69_00049113 [Brassica cretica]|uniref:Uncharacterized protein n=1 Tax=Brassica cretica TaxID=69181 RepID=A0A8S9PR70_BRACR|nr:hypothetical protein F2Q69_00049113 [Brassica cretica]
MVTKNNDELILEESLVESDEFDIKEQNKSDADDNMSFSLDRQMLQTEAVLHGQVQFSGPEKLKNDKLQSCIGLNLCEFRLDHAVDILFSHQMHRVKEIYVLPKKILSQACPYQKAHLVWEPGGSVGKQAPWNCSDKYLKHGVVLKLNAKTHETCLHNTLEVFSAEETQTWMVNEKMSFKVLPDLSLEVWVKLAVYGFKHQKLMSLLVKESRRVWERGRLTAMCALAIVTPPFDISFDNTVIQEMRKSCVQIVVGSATMRMMRWLHMIELEIVTTALGIGVSLECLEPYLSHDEVLGLTTKTHLAKETREWSNQSTLKIQSKSMGTWWSSLIDFYYIGSDVASDDADVFNEEESGEPWFGAEVAKLDRNLRGADETEDTMIGGDFEVPPSSEMQREPSLRQLLDDLEYLRIDCDKMSRNAKAMAERFDSVENPIATIGTEEKLEDSSAIMGIVMVPVFPDVDLRQWISWMEHYFARKGLNDFEKLHMAHGFIVDEAERYIDSLKPISSWKEMKETLLLKFGADDDPERIKLENEVRRYKEQLIERFQNTEVEILQDTSGNSSVEEVTLSLESLIQVSKTNSEYIEKDSQLGYQRIENRDGVLTNVEFPVFSGRFPLDWICRAESFFDSGGYNDMEKLKLISLSFKGSVLHWFNGEMTKAPFSDWLQFTDRLLGRFSGSSDPEAVPEIPLVATTLGCSSPEGLRQHPLTPAIDQEAISTDETELFDNVLSHEKDSVKNETIVAVDHEADSVLTEESVPELHQETALRSDTGFTGSLELSSSLIEEELQETYSSATEVCTEEKYIDKIAEMFPSWTETSQLPRVETGCENSMDGLSLFFVMHPHSFVLMISSEVKMFWKARQWEVTEFDEEAKRFQTVISKSRCVQKTFNHSHLSGRLVYWCVFRKLEHPLLSSKRFQSQTASVAECSQSTVLTETAIVYRREFENKHETSKRKRDRVALLCIRLMKLEAICWTQFTLGYINFHLEHRGAVWLWVCSDFSMAVADTRPEWQRSLIIFLYPSLRASLFSRVGVYGSILICLWIVAVLIWRYDKKEKVESELLIHEPLQIRVSSFLNCLLPQEKDLLLMHHEDNLIRVRVQQSYKKKEVFEDIYVQVQTTAQRALYEVVTMEECGVAVMFTVAR